jgi:CHAT domain-containing protein
MAALHDGRDFLIRKFAVVTSPGLSLTDPRRPLRTGNEEVLLAGLTKPVQGFPALTNVPMELKSIEALYRSRLLKDSDFRISTIKGELQRYPYPIVHIASHGEFFDNSKDTYILTWDEKLSMDDLEKIIGISRFRKEPVEVLTLSACVTAAGDDRASLGLAGVGVKAGARSALATLWYINDHTTYQLVTDFYDQLRNTSVSKAKALQHAQIKLLDDRHFRHPGYWSPFLLIGNWL